MDRRRFVNWAGLSGAAVLLSACGGSKDKGTGPIAGEKPIDSTPERPESDVADVNVLNSALVLEHQAVAAYDAAVDVLRGANRRAAATIGKHEREHVVRLTAAIKEIGGRPNTPPKNFDFGDLATEDDVLRLATRLENTALAAYIEAIPKLNDPDMRRTAAAIYANEAEHLAVLNQARGERAAPEPFVTGEEAAA